MSSILEAFACGNISPQTQFFKGDSQYAKTIRTLSCIEETLMERLNEDDKILIQSYIDAQSELNRITAVDNLMYGYKLGLMMTAEAFVTSQALIAGEPSD